ncbi:MAG: hypothetical protein LBO64_05765 [Desulfovibrio sp.]|nr:hypothetical protein [Desulfovibrio sp.]
MASMAYFVSSTKLESWLDIDAPSNRLLSAVEADAVFFTESLLAFNC